MNQPKEQVYFIETPRELYWSRRKLDVTYKHVEFLYRDKAKSKQMDEDRFKAYKGKSKKKVIHLKGDE